MYIMENCELDVSKDLCVEFLFDKKEVGPFYNRIMDISNVGTFAEYSHFMRELIIAAKEVLNEK